MTKMVQPWLFVMGYWTADIDSFYDNDRTWPGLPEQWKARALRLETSSTYSGLFLCHGINAQIRVKEGARKVLGLGGFLRQGHLAPPGQYRVPPVYWRTQPGPSAEYWRTEVLAQSENVSISASPICRSGASHPSLQYKVATINCIVLYCIVFTQYNANNMLQYKVTTMPTIQ